MSLATGLFRFANRAFTATSKMPFGRFMSAAAAPPQETAVDVVLARIKARDPNEPEFQQAVNEVLQTLRPLLSAKPQYVRADAARSDAEARSSPTQHSCLGA